MSSPISINRRASAVSEERFFGRKRKRARAVRIETIKTKLKIRVVAESQMLRIESVNERVCRMKLRDRAIRRRKQDLL